MHPDAELRGRRGHARGADEPPVAGFPAVTVDNADGMRQAVEHLAALGHRRIAYVAGPRSSWSNASARTGCAPTSGKPGLELVHLGHFPPRFDGGVAAADPALACGVTAVIAYNDIVALGLLSRFERPRVAVPAAISVLGFDDIPMSAMVHPALTTVRPAPAEAGRAAVAISSPARRRPAPAPPDRELPTAADRPRTHRRRTRPRVDRAAEPYSTGHPD